MKKFFKRGKCGGCKGGFTLIELLVVIAIIAILATTVIVTYDSLRKKARDAERKSEITQIKRLIEIYMVDNINAPSNGDGDKTIDKGSGIALLLSDWKDGLASGPAEPSSNATYYYTSSGANYAIGANLEDDGTCAALPEGLSWPTGVEVDYCVTSK